MLKHLALGLAVCFAAHLVCPAPVEARTAKAKIQKAKSDQAARRASTRTARNGWEPFPGFPAHRDRTTIYHPNGRLNGQELFDSIADRAGDPGP